MCVCACTCVCVSHSDNVDKVILSQRVQDGVDGVLGDGHLQALHAATDVHHDDDVFGGGGCLDVPEHRWTRPPHAARNQILSCGSNSEVTVCFVIGLAVAMALGSRFAPAPSVNPPPHTCTALDSPVPVPAVKDNHAVWVWRPFNT